MRILMLTASLPYPSQQGGALRSYGILHGLAQSGHEVSLLSFHDSDNPESWRDTPLAQFCKTIQIVAMPDRSKKDRLRDLLLSNHPDIARRLWDETFFNCLKTLVREQNFDVIQFEGIEVAPYLIPLQQHGTKAKLIYDAFNAEAALQRVIFEVDRDDWRRLPAAAYSLIQSHRIARFERDLCRAADGVIAVSAEDAAILSKHRPDHYIPVVTNGIFVDDYVEATEQLDLGDHALVFTGKMDYRPNVDAMTWFAEAIFPLVQAEIPDTHLYIVGQKPHPRLEKLREHDHISITGWVRDVQPYLQAAQVYVAPLRMGSGTRLKLLEAMASGCAVVATGIAMSGMKQETHDAIIVADEPESLAKATINLLNNIDQRKHLGEKASAFVRAHYDWSVLIPGLLEIYKGMGVG